MQITYDFHTHTKYSHGKGSILDNAISAKQKGVKGIAITDHGFSHPAFGMRRSKLAKMRQECIEAEKQTGVKVYLGIESNIVGKSGKTDVKPKDYEYLDVFCAGIHRFVYYETFIDFYRMLVDTVFCTTFKVKPSKSLVDFTTKLYVNAIEKNPIDIITHLNYLAFSDAKTVAKCCADNGTYIEISTKKVHLTDKQWEDVLSTDVKFVINSDAHTPDRIGDIKLFEKINTNLNIPLDRIVNLGENPPIMRFNEFKKKL